VNFLIYQKKIAINHHEIAVNKSLKYKPSRYTLGGFILKIYIYE
jgi:hypothetical protein